MKKPHGSATEIQPKLINIKSAAAYIGATVWFMRTIVLENRIPFLRFGHRLLFDPADLDKFIEQEKVSAA
jgi:excisionase family DNA binding protein